MLAQPDLAQIDHDWLASSFGARSSSTCNTWLHCVPGSSYSESEEDSEPKKKKYRKFKVSDIEGKYRKSFRDKN